MIKIITKIFRVFEDNGLFDEGVELIGSWCFHLYQKHLGVPEFPLRTQDIDFLIPNPYRGQKHSGFLKQLEKLGFKCDFRWDGSLYLWNEDLKIEFITPEKGRGSSRAIKVEALGLRAIPLRFVAQLLEDPITVTDDGVEILVPRPARFCLHKLVIASRRRKKDKRLKDLQQAVCASVIVKDRELQELFGAFPKKWRTAVFNVLEKDREEFPLFISEIERLEGLLRKVERLMAER